jgi:hypothetical protein
MKTNPALFGAGYLRCEGHHSFTVQLSLFDKGVKP